jgi:hypothetical protein
MSERYAYQSHSAMHKSSQEADPRQTSTLVSSLHYASRAGPWLVVQTMLASSGQNEIDVDDSNHAVW